MARRIVFTDSGFWKYSWAHLVMSVTESCRWQGSYKVLQVLEVLEFDFLKFKSWKTLENSHIYEKVLEKYFKF